MSISYFFQKPENMARTKTSRLKKDELKKILNKMGSEFDESWTEAQLLDKIRETVEEPAEVFLEVNPTRRRRSLRLSIQAEAASETETRSNPRRQVQFEFTEEIKDRLQSIERKIDSNTTKLQSIEDNILSDLLPFILREVRDLRRNLRS